MMSLLIVAALFAAVDPPGGAPQKPQAAAVSSETTVSTMVVQGQEQKQSPNDMVCKKEALLGSRMPKRTCQLRVEWEERKVGDRDLLERVQTNLQGYR